MRPWDGSRSSTCSPLSDADCRFGSRGVPARAFLIIVATSSNRSITSEYVNSRTQLPPASSAFRPADLVRDLVEARDELTLSRLHQRYLRVALLIVDELGFVPFERTGGELLFNLLADRYERRSTVVTTNLAFSEWVRVFGDEKLTTALLDRLGHHAHILTTRGPSYRTRRLAAD